MKHADGEYGSIEFCTLAEMGISPRFPRGFGQCLNCEKRSGGTLEARRRRRRDERRRRENRGAVGAEGDGDGVSPSPTD